MTHLLYVSLGLVLVAVTLPLVLELALVTAASWLPERSRCGEKSGEEYPLAIVIPAHNEEILISRCVTSVLKSAGHSSRTRVFVVAHNCTDRTAEAARRAGAEVLVFNDPAARGKGFALSHGFQHALNGEAQAVMVIDADSVVSQNLVSEVKGLLANGAQAVQCRYEMESPTEKTSGRLAAVAFRAFNVIRPRGRERLGLSAGIFGNGFALTRSLLSEVPYGAFSVVEDLEYHLNLVLARKRVQYLDSARVFGFSASLEAGGKCAALALGRGKVPRRPDLDLASAEAGCARKAAHGRASARCCRFAHGLRSFCPIAGPLHTGDGDSHLRSRLAAGGRASCTGCGGQRTGLFEDTWLPGDGANLHRVEASPAALCSSWIGGKCGLGSHESGLQL